MFEDQIEFISTEVLKNKLKQRESDKYDNDKDGDEGDEDADEDVDDGGVSVSVKQDSASIAAVKDKKQTAHQKILAGYCTTATPLS